MTDQPTTAREKRLIDLFKSSGRQKVLWNPILADRGTMNEGGTMVLLNRREKKAIDLLPAPLPL